MNNHDQRIARTEKFQAGEDASGGLKTTSRLELSGDRTGNGEFSRQSRDDHRPETHRPKLNFPHYDGLSDPLSWLNKCESYFRDTRTIAVEQVWLASLHLDGVDDGYYGLERECSTITWGQFSKFINLQFGPPICTNSLGEIKELVCTGSVEDYQRQFLAHMCPCDDLSVRHQIDLFTAGLGQPLASDVELQKPATLQLAMSLARSYERARTAAHKALASTPKSAIPPAKPPTLALLALAAPAPTRAAPSRSRPRFRRFSAEEMAAKRAKDECYYVLRSSHQATGVPAKAYICRSLMMM